MLCLKRMLCWLLCICMVLPLVPFEALADDGVTEIYTAEDFFAIMDDPSGYYRLEKDIDLGNIAPLGFHSDKPNYPTSFGGMLDGNGHTLTYTLSYVDGCCYYGLFCVAYEAQFYNLYLNTQIDISFPEKSDGTGSNIYVGTVAGETNNTTFGGVFVSGSMNLYAPTKEEGDTLCAGGLSGAGDSNSASMCQVDMPVHIQAGNNDVKYQGLLNPGNKNAYYCGLSGDVNITGCNLTVTLLNTAIDSVSEQNVSLTARENCELTGAREGSGNLLFGEYSAYVDAADAAYTASPKLSALEREENSSFEGALEFSHVNLSSWTTSCCIGITESSFCTFYGTISGYVPDEGCFHAYGINGGSDNTFAGNIQGEGNEIRLKGAYGCERSTVLGDLTAYADFTHCAGIEASRETMMEGNITAYSDGYTLEGISNGENCCFIGAIDALSGTHDEDYENYIFGLYSSTDCVMDAELTADKENGYITFARNSSGCHFVGAATGAETHGLIDESVSCLVEADVTLTGGGRMLDSSENCSYVGQASFSEYETVFYGCTSCAVNSNLTVYDNEFTLEVAGDGNNSFQGSIDQYHVGEHPTTVYYASRFPITVHHPVVGTFNTANLDGFVYYHSPGGCDLERHVDLVVTDYLYGDVGGTEWHYNIAIQGNKSEGTTNYVTPDWVTGYDPESEEYQTSPASYSIQVVAPGGNSVENARLLINGSDYYSDADGCVDIVEGHKVIRGLEIAVEDENGEWRTVKTYSVYYPIPDKLNRIELVMEPEVALTSEAFPGAAQQTGEAKGLTTNILGLEIPILQLPISLDLEQIVNDLPIQYEYDRKDMTGTILYGLEDSVNLGNKTRHDDNYEDVVNTLKGILNNNSADLVARSQARSMLKSASDRHSTGSLGADLTMNIMAYAKLNQSNFFVPVFQEGGVYTAGNLEGRVVYHLVPWLPPVYVTGALNGELELFLRLLSTEAMQQKGNLLTFEGDLTFTPGVEMALGVGSRATRIYVEGGGRAELEVNAELPYYGAQDSLTIDATGEVFGEARFLALGGRFSKEFTSVQYWPQTSPTMLLSMDDVGEMSVLSRSYAENAVMPRSNENGLFLGLSEDNAYPYTQLSIHWVRDNTFLLVYTDDDLTRGAADRSTLRACFGTLNGEGGIDWGESVTLDDDGTGDYGFIVKAVENSAVIVWQDAAETFGDGEGLTPESLAASVQLSQIKVDCSGELPTVSETGIVAPAGNYPYNLSVCFDGENAYTSWVTTDNPDPTSYTDSERETIWLSISFGEEGWAIAEDQTNISGLALTYGGLLWSSAQGEETVLYRRDWDGNITEEASGNIHSLQSNGWKFCYVHDEVLYVGDSWENREEVASGNDLSNLVHMNANCEVFTVEKEGDISRICQVVNGQVLPIGILEGSVGSYDVEAGHIIALTRTGFTESDTAGIHIVPTQQVEQVDVSEVACSNPTAVPGSSVTISVEVTNNGYNTLTSVPIEIVGQDGSLLQQDVEVNIQPGESQWVEVSLTVPENFEPQQLVLNVMGISRDLELGGNNLALDASWTETRPDGIQATVTNTGSQTVTGTVQANGEKQSVTVEPGQSTDLWFSLGGEPKQEQTITVTLEEPDDCLIQEDNEISVNIRPVMARALRLGGVSMIVGSEIQAQVQTWPVNSVVEELTFEIKDTGIACVNSAGNITALKAGTTQITVTAMGKRPLSVTAELVVIDDDSSDPTTKPEETVPNNPSKPEETKPTEPLCEHKWSRWTITNPTSKKEGLRTRECQICGEKESEVLKKLSGKFTDVPENQYYALPVDWAVQNGVTNGTSATTFSPDATCTRGQVVTFLWRAAGSPEPTSFNNPFVDVKASDYFYKAVLWAVENGVTTGTGKDTFSPGSGCTRAQVATFLWRSQGKPTAANKNPFADVKNGEYYYDAVIWAVENGVTTGTSVTTFAPNSTCTRGQIVTFLYRALA